MMNVAAWNSVEQLLGFLNSALIGGVSYSMEEIDQMREEQEKKQNADARFARVRLRVSTAGWKWCVFL